MRVDAKDWILLELKKRETKPTKIEWHGYDTMDMSNCKFVAEKTDNGITYSISRKRGNGYDKPFSFGDISNLRNSIVIYFPDTIDEVVSEMLSRLGEVTTTYGGVEIELDGSFIHINGIVSHIKHPTQSYLNGYNHLASYFDDPVQVAVSLLEECLNGQ